MSSLEVEFSSFSPPNNDVDAYSNYLDSFLRILLDKYFPVKFKRISAKRIGSPWINNDILMCISKKHKLHIQAKLHKITWNSYKNYCTLLRKLLNTAEEDYYRNKFNNLGQDCKKNWKLLNKLLNKNSKKIGDRFLVGAAYVTNSNEISDLFNQHFIENPKRISENIPWSNNDFFHLIRDTNEIFNFFTSNPEEVTREISN